MNTRKEPRTKRKFLVRRARRENVIPLSARLFWPFIGLLLTISGTFLQAAVINMPWQWANGPSGFNLGVTYQVGAVLLTGCLAGRDGAIVSQFAYLILGLTSISVFAQGGGLDYWKEPSFGYILGFIPGSALCGWLAFRKANSLFNLTFSVFCGLFIIHLVGIVYLILLSRLSGNPSFLELPSFFLHYSIYSLPGQFIVVSLASFASYLLRRILVY